MNCVIPWMEAVMLEDLFPAMEIPLSLESRHHLPRNGDESQTSNSRNKTI